MINKCKNLNILKFTSIFIEKLSTKLTGLAVWRHQTLNTLSILPAAINVAWVLIAISVISALAPLNVDKSLPVFASHNLTK